MPASILVVDDESSITHALDLLLRDHGYEVHTASTAAEAETLLARRWFDLVFLDLRLPDADGILLSRRRNIPRVDREDFGIIGNNSQLRQVRAVIRTAAPSDASVLIEGESGTGKEMIASALHVQSERAGRPFTRINCAAIPSTLIESELFGYRKGAFTGAHHDRRGLIEALRERWISRTFVQDCLLYHPK